MCSPLRADTEKNTGAEPCKRVLGAIGVDGAQTEQVASRGAAGLVKSGKTTNANNNFATARVNTALAA